MLSAWAYSWPRPRGSSFSFVSGTDSARGGPMDLLEWIRELEEHRAVMLARGQLDPAAAGKLDELQISLELAGEKYAEYVLAVTEGFFEKIQAHRSNMSASKVA